MPASQRTRIINKLKTSSITNRVVISNARCLSEGVDVPSLDGIAFIEPKSSQTDIIQCVGRAIRKTEDKTTGTIFLPVFIDSEKDDDDIFDGNEYQTVWKVISALKSHDDTLDDQINNFRININRRKNVRDFDFDRIVFDLPR